MICRFQYTAVAEYVLNIIDPVLANYQSAVGVYPPQANGSVSHFPGKFPRFCHFVVIGRIDFLKEPFCC